MKKMLVLCLVLGILFSGCAPSSREEPEKGSGEKEVPKVERKEEAEVEEKVDKVLFDEVTVSLNLLTPQTDDYVLFLVKPGVLKGDLKAPPTADYVGPIDIEGFEKTFRISEHLKIEGLLEDLGDAEKKLQLAITTREDYLLRHPLNDEQYIYFEQIDHVLVVHEATKGHFSLDIWDEYPEGVISLPFPQAQFVIKFVFPEGVEPRNTYTARIREFNAQSPTGLGIYAPGSPMVNKMSYYNAAFWGDNFKSYSGVLEIVDGNNQRISFEGEPMTITFDAEGFPEQSVLHLKILE